MIKIERGIYFIFILLLPYCALGYLRNIFQGLALNASVYPLVVGILLLCFYTCYSGKIYLKNKKSKNVFKILILFIGCAIVSTLIMNFVLSLNIYEFMGENPLTHSITKLMTIIVIPVIIYYVVYSVKNEKIARLTIKLIYVSIFIVIIYGYIQLFAYYIPGSIFNRIYITISNMIDFAWSNGKGWNYVLLSGGRLNLTTPEPSEATHLFNVLLYPLLLAALINNFTIYKRKIFNISIELWIFIISLPLLIHMFSSTGYIISLIQFLFAIFIFCKKYKKSFMRFIFIMIFVVILMGLLYKVVPNDIQYKITFFSAKIGDINNTSTNSRFAGSIAALGIFKDYPLIGVGWNNVGFIINNYIPEWARYNIELSNNLSDSTKGWPTGGAQWTNLLSSFGILGSVIFVYFIYVIFKYLKQLKDRNSFLNYTYVAFLEFIIGFVLQGFNSPTFNFIFQWAMLGFFISVINISSFNNQTST